MVQTEEAVPTVVDIPQRYVLHTPAMNETVATGVELESISWQGVVFSGWLVGTLVLLALLGRRFYFVTGLIAKSKPANERSLEMLDECRSRIGISRDIELRLTGNKLSPAVCGLFKPVILIPSALLKKLSREKLKTVLIHELAHVKRGDAWVNLLQTMLQIVYFYNPLVWLANAMVRRAREQAVDEMVLVTLRPETKNYSNMLIDIAETAFWRPNFSLSIIGVAESKRALERRISHMLTRPVPKSSKLGCLGLTTIVVIGAILLPMNRNSTAQAAETKTIVPGVRVGDYTLDMTKDDVLKELGEPEAIQLGDEEVNVVRRGQEKYNLNNLPNHHILIFKNLSFWMTDDSIEGISVHSPLYKLSNGVGVGDSEQKIKQAFGEDFQTEEVLGRDFICYLTKGLAFAIHKKNQTVVEIAIYHPQGERDAPDQQEHSQQTIVPGLGVGDYTLGMSKDEVLKKLGEPENIQYGGERYTLNNLPRRYYMSFGDISFGITDDTVTGISVNSPRYKFTNGRGVGDSEEKIKQAFGSNFQIEEAGWKSQLNYENKGLQFEIRNEDRTVIGIDVYQAEGNQRSDRRSRQELLTTVRKAAAQGRISFKLTTPDEFKAIVGRPTRERTESDDEAIYMEYPGIRVRFSGRPEIDTPHTLVSLSCEGKEIDIGRNRPVVLRDEGDLDKFGTFWGYSSADLSRLDLSQKGELLKVMPFDSRTVWPESDRLPPDFDPEKGIHVAIIDQPLLLGHIEYKDKLISYKEIQTGNADPQMHGPPVASILVGKTCGVAPGAILHYWAEPSWKGDYKYRCIALEQIIQFNKGKERSEQIRVVSVSKGFSPSEPNLDRWKTLLEKAKKSGIYIVHCGSMGFGAGCRFLEDSDNPANYRLCTFYKGGDVYHKSGTFFTPIDHRTTASQRAKDAYTFWTRSGLSWGAPYYAGVVALGIQVNPNLRPDQIDKLLYDSGWDFQRGKLINPVGFVEAARKAGAGGQ
jgi:beta-lactamase regulating signal transducer with metallopeptidase domain